MNDSRIPALQEKARRLRVHSIRATSQAGSGHPTSCLSAADLVAALFFAVMRYDPHNPGHPANDRFVLSKGHAAPLLYAAWAEAGLFPPEKMLTLRQFTSELEGHPTPRFPGADVATGSLGQGLSMAAGMALAARLDQMPYRVFALLGDGEAAEGAVWEAVAFASYYKLGNLTAIFDINTLGQSQRTMYGGDLATYQRRLEAAGWQALAIDGHNFREILPAFEKALAERDRPTAIVARTVKGQGVSFAADKEGWHGKPFKKGEEEQRALAELAAIVASTDELKIAAPARGEPSFTTSVHDESRRAANLRPPPAPTYKLGEGVATREAYGAALAKLGDVDARVIAIDGDTKNSTFSEYFLKAHPERFFECFIAEQNMVGLAVGLATRGKVPFASTFACFLTRAYDHIRMAAIGRANIKLCGSHAGVSIGEDGPSQMGLEDLAMMRAIPDSVVFYPCDAVSCWRMVGEAARHQGIVYIRTTRPKTPVIYANEDGFPIGGFKVLRQSDGDRALVIAAGVTLHEALQAHAILAAEGLPARVIDLYCLKPLDRDALTREARAAGGMVVTVEDHYAEGGLGDAVLDALAGTGIPVQKLAVREVPRSGKPDELLDAYGISARRIATAVCEVVSRKSASA